MKLKHQISEQLRRPLTIPNISRYFVFFCLAVGFYYFFRILSPFFSILVFSSVIAIALAPVHRFVSRLFHFENLSAAISCLLVFFLIIVPFLGFLLLFWNQIVLFSIAVRPAQWASLHAFPFFDQIVSWIQSAKISLLQLGPVFAGFIFRSVFAFVVFFFTLFHLFRDGRRILRKLVQLSPLSHSYEKKLVTRVGSLMRVIFYGTIFSTVLQGILGSIGFSISGIGQPVFWGIVIALFSCIPYIGVALVWVPMAAILYAAGDKAHALFLALWASVIISSVDAIFRPLLISQKIDIHPMLLFLSVVGGIVVCGPAGIVVGPFLLIVITTLSENKV